MRKFFLTVFCCFPASFLLAAETYPSPFVYSDPQPQRYSLSERASKIDPRVKSHPEINFVLEKDGKAKDTMSAVVDTSVKPRGKLVISLMGSGELFKRTAKYGMHSIHVPYAAGWFSILTKGEPKETWRGDIRLEAATGDDHSKLLDIPKPDSLMERALQFVKWLAKNNPQAKWEHFLTADGTGLRWEDVVVCGLSHGSTTAARFAQHVKLDRVICFSGPRDQDQSWQALPSATPGNRYFVFTHVRDSGWEGKHYCRSWELLGLNKYGPVVDVEQVKFPYENTRRLVTSIEGKGSMKFHNGVAPNVYSFKNADATYAHEEVWRYLFTHPVDEVGAETPLDPLCQKKK